MQNNKEEKEYTIFDKTDIYNEEIQPILDKLDIVCKANKIPYFFTACVKNDETESEYRNEGNLCGSNEFVLKTDKITDFFRILCGFKLETKQNGEYVIAPPGEDIEINFEEII